MNHEILKESRLSVVYLLLHTQADEHEAAFLGSQKSIIFSKSHTGLITLY